MVQETQQLPETGVRYAPPRSGWTGWVAFAAVMMLLLGAFQVIEGIVALVDDTYFVARSSDLTVHVSYDTWGWTHLVIGLVAVFTGLGLLSGNLLARAIGVLVAMVSAVVNLAFLGAYPVWSTIMIVLDVVIIWAIVVHGGEMKDAR